MKLKVVKFILSNMKTKNNAHLILERERFTQESIIGSLYLNGSFVCKTLELPYLANSTNISSVPCGLYDLTVRGGEKSRKFPYVHLQVMEVPDRSYILFHIGNTAKDTQGCILTGMSSKNDIVFESKKAHTLLMQVILDNYALNTMELLIKNRL